MTGKCAQPEASVSLNIKSGKPVITWEKISGAKKYEVYRATSENGKYSKIGTSTKTSYTDTKASVGTTYYYKVVAAGSKSSYNSIQSAATEAVTALMAQPSMTVKNDSKTGKPVISWGKVSGATQYVVMYVDVTDFMESEEGPDEAYLEQNMKPLTTTKTSVTLTDAELGHVYMVTMTAVPKNEEFFSIPMEPQYVAATCLAPKISGKIDAQSGKPSATWKEVDGAEGYAVYRSTKSSSGYTCIGYVEEAGFIDGSAVKGKTYYYKVTAIAGYSESAMSNSVKLKSK
jgi:fibronectin type 3 domain-containing protein